MININGNISDHFKTSKEEISIHFVASKTGKESKAVQVARLKDLLVGNGLKLYNSIKDDLETEIVEYVINKLLRYKKNVAMYIIKQLKIKLIPESR